MDAKVSLWRDETGYWFIAIEPTQFGQGRHFIPITTRKAKQLRTKYSWPLHKWCRWRVQEDED